MPTIDDDESHVTRRELGMELRSFRNEVRVLIAVAVVAIRFDVPKELTAAAIVAMVGKSLIGFIHR